MSEKKQERKPTPPSEAPGESGDRAAREEAQDAIVPGTGDAGNDKDDDEAGPGRDGRTERDG
ncbi:hypothetical protein AB0D46_11730 [Streptomyces sp. NPDC048383]|uniref:hypothetical protein n=1 Tax=Streptomyces sp. NPDC048383 TaxID=3155386 RepID=UPI0034279FC5